MIKKFRSKKDMTLEELESFFEWQREVYKDDSEILFELYLEREEELERREAELLPF